MASAHQIDIILRWHNAGYDVPTTARLLKLDPREVKDIIDTGGKPEPVKPAPPEFSDRPLWEGERPRTPTCSQRRTRRSASSSTGSRPTVTHGTNTGTATPVDWPRRSRSSMHTRGEANDGGR